MLLQQVSRLAFLFLILPLSASAKPDLLKVTGCLSPGTLYLYSFRGNEQTLMDSLAVTGRDTVTFPRAGSYPPGFYRLSFEDDYLDIILVPEEVPLVIAGECLLGSATVKNSQENAWLQELKQYARQPMFNAMADSLFNVAPASVFTVCTQSYMAVNKAFVSPADYLSQIPFHDERLIRSTVLPHIYMRYFRDFVAYDEAGFRNAIDTLLQVSAANPIVQEYTLDFLFNLFHTAGPEVVFEYLADKYYRGESCNEDGYGGHIDDYMKLRPGMMAPDTMITTIDGNPLQLSEIYKESPLTLLFFWSSYCPHCHEMQPIIREMAAEFSATVQVIGISLDGEKEECLKAVKRYQTSWPVTCEGIGWDSPVRKLFMINKTPSYVVIDRAGRLVSRNPSEEDLRKIFISYQK